MVDTQDRSSTTDLDSKVCSDSHGGQTVELEEYVRLQKRCRELEDALERDDQIFGFVGKVMKYGGALAVSAVVLVGGAAAYDLHKVTVLNRNIARKSVYEYIAPHVKPGELTSQDANNIMKGVTWGYADDFVCQYDKPACDVAFHQVQTDAFKKARELIAQNKRSK
jgi:hypothetical protein